MLAVSHVVLFSPILLRLVRERVGSWEKTPRSLGMYSHPSVCYLTLWFLGWIMGSELRLEEIWVLLDSLSSFHGGETEVALVAVGGWPLLCAALHRLQVAS